MKRTTGLGPWLDDMDQRNPVTNTVRKRFPHLRRHVFSTTGFTLIEVVVAMAILSVGIAVLIELFSGSLRLLRTSGEYTKAVNYARVKMEELTVKPTMNEGTEEGEFDGAYRWQVDVKRVDILPARIETDFKPPVELFLVKVHVLWRSGAKERSAVLETYRTFKLEEEEKKS
jgi:general secretion pathway protein I